MTIEIPNRLAANARASRRFCALAIMSALLAAVGSPSVADVSSEQTDGITIESAVVMTAGKDAAARLSFRIINFSSEDLTLTGVETGASASAVILLDVPGEGQRPVESLAIRQEETLNFGTSHILVQLEGIKAGITSGDDVPFELNFRNQKAKGLAHAH